MAKTDKFQKALDERETAARKAAEDNRAMAVTEQEKTGALEAAVEAAELAVEDLEAKARAGDASVTGKVLMEARGDVEVTRMALAGNQSRTKRLSNWLVKSNTHKDVAEIVREALVARMFPGAASYATFANVKDAKPDTLPALVVTQLDGKVGSDGVGEGRVQISWFRSPLHAPMDKDRLRNALEASGFNIDPRFGFDGMVSRSTGDADAIEVGLRGVAEEIPVVTHPLDNVDGADESLALEIDRSEDVEATGAGAQIVSSNEDDNGIRTTVVKVNVGVKQTNHGNEINLLRIVKGKAENRLEKVRKGLGRCVETDVNLVHFVEDENAHSIRQALVTGNHIYAAEFVYKSKAA